MLMKKYKYFYGSCLLAASQFALAGSGETPISEGLGYVTNAMYGATGITIATISVMIVGLLCLGHFLRWSVLGYTIMGISIIFGAGSIVNGIFSLVRN
jgi:type IV secretory pathway VirB2 component (pilin)